MVDIQLVISDPDTGESHQIEVGDRASLEGQRIGEEISGDAFGLSGYTLEVTGGSDETGRPLRGDVEGEGIHEVLVAGGTGFNPTRKGERRRVSVRGGLIGGTTVQVNAVVTESGQDSIGELLESSEEESDEEEAEE